MLPRTVFAVSAASCQEARGVVGDDDWSIGVRIRDQRDLVALKLAVTPAPELLIREMTELMLSLALTVMAVPLTVNDPAVTCALLVELSAAGWHSRC